jgi:hypothetical protein
MAAILAQMHGDAVRPGTLGHVGRVHRVRITRPARLPQCRDMIDVYTQKYFGSHADNRLE